jgi:hypothetical protein
MRTAGVLTERERRTIYRGPSGEVLLIMRIPRYN